MIGQKSSVKAEKLLFRLRIYRFSGDYNPMHTSDKFDLKI